MFDTNINNKDIDSAVIRIHEQIIEMFHDNVRHSFMNTILGPLLMSYGSSLKDEVITKKIYLYTLVYMRICGLNVNPSYKKAKDVEGTISIVSWLYDKDTWTFLCDPTKLINVFSEVISAVEDLYKIKRKTGGIW